MPSGPATPQDNRLTRSSDFVIEPLSGGELRWGVSAARGNSQHLSVGWCLLDPGQANTRHYHPNCDEVLVVVDGSITHSWNSEEMEMSEGDAISIPQGVVHNARNTGEARARLLICFSSATRETVAEEETD